MTRQLIWLAVRILAIAVIPAITNAETGVMIPHVPAGANAQPVLAVVKQAFLRHGWEVMLIDSTSVAAALNGTSRKVALTVRIDNGQLLYEGVARYVATNLASPTTPGTVAPIPKRWLEELRKDIALGLATMPDAPTI